MRRHTLVLVLAVTAVIAAACTRGIERAADVLAGPSHTPALSTTPSVSFTPSPSAIRIRTPRGGDDVLSPVVVSGTAISDAGKVVVDLLDAQGMELAAMYVPIDCGSACRGRFRAELAFYVAARQTGTIEVYEVGPGGVAEHLVQVHVTLVPGV
ncbi:MAG: Gmad2 immunoglobulin-like domain-containing protein [Solirubrobacterales bacterium]